jgi:hypothetical protein
MNTKLRPAPHYFVIDSIGGMNEGYSDTTCSRIEDVVAPEYGKAMVEEYIDQWAHDRLEYYTECIENQTERTEVNLVRYDIKECPHGGWVRLTPEFSDSIDEDDIADWGFHTLFIQVYDGTMLGDSVVVYDQLDDTVATITGRATAIRIAEEFISIDVERIKQKVYDETNHGGWDRHYTTKLIHSYDSLAEVVRNLEYPQHCMIDIDDCCTHFFPTQGMDFKTYNQDNRIITL